MPSVVASFRFALAIGPSFLFFRENLARAGRGVLAFPLGRHADRPGLSPGGGQVRHPVTSVFSIQIERFRLGVMPTGPGFHREGGRCVTR